MNVILALILLRRKLVFSEAWLKAKTILLYCFSVLDNAKFIEFPDKIKLTGIIAI